MTTDCISEWNRCSQRSNWNVHPSELLFSIYSISPRVSFALRMSLFSGDENNKTRILMVKENGEKGRKHDGWAPIRQTFPLDKLMDGGTEMTTTTSSLILSFKRRDGPARKDWMSDSDLQRLSLFVWGTERHRSRGWSPSYGTFFWMKWKQFISGLLECAPFASPRRTKLRNRERTRSVCAYGKT